MTGVRKDPYAEQHRIVPETPKAADDRSKYLHPELYGQPETARIGYRETDELRVSPRISDPAALPELPRGLDVPTRVPANPRRP